MAEDAELELSAGGEGGGLVRRGVDDEAEPVDLDDLDEGLVLRSLLGGGGGFGDLAVDLEDDAVDGTAEHALLDARVDFGDLVSGDLPSLMGQVELRLGLFQVGSARDSSDEWAVPLSFNSRSFS